MNINDLVLSLETCKRLKEAGFEFPDSVFVWYKHPHETEPQPFIRDEIYTGWVTCDTLTLHEVYCWVLELSKKPEFRGDTPLIKFVYGDTDMQDRIIFSAPDSFTGQSPELNPLIAADRYINNLLDKGILNHG